MYIFKRYKSLQMANPRSPKRKEVKITIAGISKHEVTEAILNSTKCFNLEKYFK